MADALTFELVSPERKLASAEADAVTIPGMDGDLTAMADHAPFLTTLRPGMLVVRKGAEETRFAVTGGFADIHNPETMAGKVLTVVLVILGMVLVGIFTATLTTVMVGDEDDMEQLRTEMGEHFAQLLQRIEQIEQHLRSADRDPQEPREDRAQ